MKIPFQTLSSSFCYLDRDGDGVLSAEELQVLHKEINKSGKLTSEQVLCISKNIIKDTNNDGKINLNEYSETLPSLSDPGALEKVLLFKSRYIKVLRLKSYFTCYFRQLGFVHLT